MFTRGYVTNPGFFWPWDVHPHHNPHPKGPRLVTTLSFLEVPIAVLVRVIILKDLRGQFFLRSRGIPGGTFGRCGNLDIQLSRYQMLPATPCYLFDGPFFFDASGAPSPYENLGLSGVFNMSGWWDSTWLDQRRHGTDGFFSRPIREILKGVPLVQPRSPFKWDFCGLLAVLQAFATLGSLLQTILSPSRQPSADRIELGTSRVMDGGDQICLCLVRFLFTSWRVTDGMMKGQECETYFHRRRFCCWIKHGLQVANPCGLCRSSQVNVKRFPKGLSLQL